MVVHNTGSGTSPPFSCGVSGAELVYRPIASKTARLAAISECYQLVGIDVVGEYVVASTEMIVVKGLDLERPVANLGGRVIFTESWTAPSIADGDAAADQWDAVNLASGGGLNNCTAAENNNDGLSQRAGGSMMLASGCGVRGKPHAARTLNFFRHPLTIAVSNVTVLASSTAALRIALEVPTATAMAATSWPSVRHYLPLEPPTATAAAPPATAAAAVADADASQASLTAALYSNGSVQLLQRRVHGKPEAILGSSIAAAAFNKGTTTTDNKKNQNGCCWYGCLFDFRFLFFFTLFFFGPSSRGYLLSVSIKNCYDNRLCSPLSLSLSTYIYVYICPDAVHGFM